jgi:hypothetical protein
MKTRVSFGQIVLIGLGLILLVAVMRGGKHVVGMMHQGGKRVEPGATTDQPLPTFVLKGIAPAGPTPEGDTILETPAKNLIIY